MMSNLTAATDVQAFQSTITTFVSDLAIAMNPQVPVAPPTYAAPVANAGMDQNVIAGTVVSLDGSKSTDVYGNRITYAWMIKAKPLGSTALLSLPTSVNPQFTADMVGSYEFELIVSNEKNQQPSWGRDNDCCEGSEYHCCR